MVSSGEVSEVKLPNLSENLFVKTSGFSSHSCLSEVFEGKFTKHRAFKESGTF